LLVIEAEDGKEESRTEKRLLFPDPFSRAREISGTGVEILICGAVSWPLEMALSSAGVKVIPHTCGQVDEVVEVFLSGGFTEDSFLMPGCCHRRRRFRNGPG